jgi:hypothetical protein
MSQESDQLELLSPEDIGAIISSKSRHEIILQLLPDVKADWTLSSIDQTGLSMLLVKVGASALHNAMESASAAAMKNLASVAGESELRKLLPGATTTCPRSQQLSTRPWHCPPVRSGLREQPRDAVALISTPPSRGLLKRLNLW